jgi:uncharacterized alkaline shock family protein YloU
MKDRSLRSKKGVETRGREVDLAVENANELGVVKIHENVISSIVRKATCSVEGVSRLAGSALVDNIAEIVGSRKMHDRAIGIKIDGAEVEIEVKVNVEYGSHVPSLAANVQSSVMENVERITGMKVTKVDVVIQELEEEPEEEEEEEENEEEEDNE